MKLKEFGKFQEIKLELTSGFRAYLNGCWRKRYALYDDSYLYGDESDVMEQRFLTFDGNLIKARNYVGFIRYKEEDITIYPKVFPNDIVEQDIDGFLITNLIYWVKRCTRVKFPIVDTNIDFKKGESFIEILIYIFSKITLDQVYNNPYSSYEEIEEEMQYLKGRLNVNEYIKSSISTGKWSSFNNIHEPFMYDNKVNKVIKSVSKMLLSVTKNSESIENIKRILFILAEVEDIYSGEDACNGININRFNKDYETIIALCDMFLKNTTLSASKDSNRLDFCFLIPMELLYEDFIFNFISEKYSEKFRNITKQKSNLYLSDLYINNSYEGKMFNLKQDIYLRDLKDNVFIVDTKYKLLNNNKRDKYGISQGDMYQMCSYALRGGYKYFLLIYPKTFESIEKMQFTINDGLADTKVKINVMKATFHLNYYDYKKEDEFEKLYLLNDRTLDKELGEYLLKSVF